jgi:hypothetical protein
MSPCGTGEATPPAVTLEEHIRQVADSAPPLSPEQAARLRSLLPPPAAGDDS